MGARNREWSGIRDSSNAQRIEQDLVRLRQIMLEHHDVSLAVDDPVCLEFTMFSHVMERALVLLQQERQDTVEELQTVLQAANHSVHAILEDAGKPLAKTMAETFDPRGVANRIMAELIDDLRRECGQAVREARRLMVGVMVVTLAASFLVLYLASKRLATAEGLLHLAPVAAEHFEPPPMPPSHDPSREGS